MHETCNVREKPFALGSPLDCVERLAPDDPLFDRKDFDEPRKWRPRRPLAIAPGGGWRRDRRAGRLDRSEARADDTSAMEE